MRRSLTARSQFVLAGNIRDIYLTPCDGEMILLPIVSCLWEALREEGYEFLLIYDMVDYLRVSPNDRSTIQAANKLSCLNLKDGHREITRAELPQCLRQLIGSPSHGQPEQPISDMPRLAIVIDYASRLASGSQSLNGDMQEFFTSFEKFSYTATPKAGPDGIAKYNPIIWLVDQAGDLPDWFVVNNDLVRSLTIPIPDLATRQRAAEELTSLFFDYGEYPKHQQLSYAKTFAELTDSMSIKSMMAVTQIASSEPKISLDNISDAVRCFKIGIPDNPWKEEFMREQIATAESKIYARVKGQSEAVTKTLDILKRSVMSLTGAHASGATNRPRGVLFFAGPTGVGKTELAKTIAQILFGDEEAYIRFDMSEFSAEQSDQRLIGAPPGYIGYDSGGELTNAIKQRPFSVVLFDEIEKAHPRILDKFLQILEDGRLTDSRGDTVYFSESVIIFTSNLGVFIPDVDQNTGMSKRVQNVQPGMEYEEVKLKIHQAIQDYFRFDLNRPEILNRIGDNIVIFNFIELKFAEEIFEKMLGNIISRVQEEHKLQLEISCSVCQQLKDWCLSDLSNGGRGIGNLLETKFINPLARALFDLSPSPGEALVVQHIESLHDRCEIKF